jgi:hypothetical protein
MTMNRLNRNLLLCAATAIAASVAGCASPDASTAIAHEDEAETLGLQAPPQSTAPIKDPNGVWFGSVTANGTGCRPGTWNTSISEDGLAFTTTFSEYVVEIAPTNFQATKDCTLTIKMNSPGGISYAVSEFYYSGYALTEPGVTVEQTALYGFQGTSVSTTNQNRTVLPKPPETSYDADFVFRDTVETSDLVWSPCGTTRELNIRTRLTLKNGQNGKPRANGYANLAAVDGNTRLEFRLAILRCGDAGPGVTIPDGGIRAPR